MTQYARLRDNLRDVEIALDEMREKDILLSYKTEKFLENSKRNKLLDAKFILVPNPSYAGEIIQANKKQLEIKTAELPNE